MSWKKIQLAEFLEDGRIDILTGPFGTQLKASDYALEGTPLINVRNVGYGELRLNKLEFVPSQVVLRLSKHLLKPHDIVFGRKGAVDRHLLVNESEAGWMQGSDCIRLRVITNEIHPAFLSFAFRLPSHKQWMITQCSNKATMASLNQDIIGRISVKLPDISTQARIASILSAYDNLIENNQRRIQLLEQAARLLYREWFVHLRFPGHEHVRIEDGVPEGWERKTLSVIAVTNVESYKVSGLPDEINYIDISSVSQGRIITKNTMQSVEAPGRARRKAKSGDIVWSNVRPNLRAFALILDPEDNDVFSTGFTVLSPVAVPFSYLYLLVTTDDFVGHLVNHATGVSYPAVRPEDFKRAAVLVPSKSVLELFHEKTEPIYMQIFVLEKENNALTKARDLLLQRLMNGEVVV